MFPLLAAAAVVGVGAQIFGAVSGSQAARRQAEASKNIAALEQKVEEQRQMAMRLDSRRRLLQEFRKAQQARAMVLATAASQGLKIQGSNASIYGGAFGNISGESNTNIVGLGQSLEIGENVFGLNSQISQQKIAYANAGGDLATASAISSVGKSITSSLGSFARLGG